MSEKSGGYIGKIQNAGTQKVQAPYQSKPAKKGTVVKGTDLRAGRGGSR